MEYEITQDELERFRLYARKFAKLYYRKFYLNAIISLEDLVQEGILGLLNAQENYDPSKEVSFEKYAKIKISYAIIDFIRKEFPYLALTHELNDDRKEELINEPYEYSKELHETEQKLLVKDLLSCLSDSDKLILYSLYYEDYSIRELGTIIDKPKSTVHCLHHNIIKTIRDALNISPICPESLN